MARSAHAPKLILYDLKPRPLLSSLLQYRMQQKMQHMKATREAEMAMSIPTVKHRLFSEQRTSSSLKTPAAKLATWTWRQGGHDAAGRTPVSALCARLLSLARQEVAKVARLLPALSRLPSKRWCIAIRNGALRSRIETDSKQEARHVVNSDDANTASSKPWFDRRKRAHSSRPWRRSGWT